MTSKPVKPSQQTTPPSQTNKQNIGNFGGDDRSNNIVINQGLDASALQQILEELKSAQSDPASEVSPVFELDISPADLASVPNGAFLSVSAPIVAGSVDFRLPSNFTYTLSPVSGGQYGTVVTDSAGNQSITVNVDIETLDGIIDYEVRLIKND